MHYIIPIAGESQRFREVGIVTPKWAILLDDSPVLSLSIASLPINEFDNISIVALQKHQSLLENILEEMQIICAVQVFYLAETPAGQSLSALNAVKNSDYDPEAPITIWCGDSFVTPKALIDIPVSGNWLSCAKLRGDHWSFARSENGKVVETSEKIRISESASIGLYGFASGREFDAAIQNSLTSQKIHELYIAPLYNYLISHGAMVDLHQVDEVSYFCVGTPKELDELSGLHGWKVSYPDT